MNVWLGIDPGVNGAFCVWHYNRIKKYREARMGRWDNLDDLHNLRILSGKFPCAILEKINIWSNDIAVIKRQESLVVNYGQWLGYLFALGIPVKTVKPRTWQAFWGLDGNKKAHIVKANQLVNQTIINHDQAVALLLAEYGRRIWIKN